MVLTMLGGSEIAIICVIVVLIFGPSKLPLLGSGLGMMLRGFKTEIRAMEADTCSAPEADAALAPEARVETESGADG